jgi:hypothetical protein
MIILLASWLTAQQNDYWKNATVEGKKIYTISFSDKQNGYAVSADNEIFITKDAGLNWELSSSENETAILNEYKNIWLAEIYCSIMQTTDGGLNWNSYSKEKQDHFCKVYLKDPNTKYSTASEFLSKVTREIKDSISVNKIDNLVNHPKQCTEYYCNESEGWALGWCVKKINIYDE